MKRFLVALLTAVLFLLLSTAVGLGFIHITNLPYTQDFDRLELAEKTGASREEAMENYNAVMDFLSPFSSKTFDLPTMKYSESGASHFEDCKPIFNGVYLLGAVSLIALSLLAWRRKLSRRTLRTSGTLTLAIPVVLGLGMISNFDKLFVTFHKVFFSNDDWIFDPEVDEIIRILPEEFFMHCAFVIGLMWLAASAFQLLLSGNEKRD